VAAELARLQADPDCVRRLTGWAWIAEAARQLPALLAA
jgi:hypothetical protein